MTEHNDISKVLNLAFELCTYPGFDNLHDPNPATTIIEPYYDPVGFPTIGYGHLLSRNKWEDLSKYTPITSEEAEKLCKGDLLIALRSVQRLCPVALGNHQLAALTDFVYNCGAGNLQVSSLRKCVNRGDHRQAMEEFGKWVYASKKKLQGLVRRRAAEASLYGQDVE